jgi:hypothetical protein
LHQYSNIIINIPFAEILAKPFKLWNDLFLKGTIEDFNSGSGENLPINIRKKKLRVYVILKATAQPEYPI